MTDPLTPDERTKLLERVQKAEQVAEESKIEAAIYREQLIKVMHLAQRAVKEKHFDFIHGVVSLASETLNDDNDNVKKWGRSWRVAWITDLGWLKDALSALKRIKAIVGGADIDKDSPHFALQQKLLSIASPALYQRVPSSIGIDEIKADSKEINQERL